MRRCRAAFGFTLIELLVVIAIIAILAAILFPVFMRAKSQGMLASCISNMKQWSAGLNNYITDYDGHYPYAGATKPFSHKATDGGTDTCYNALKRYVGNAEGIKWCPLMKTRKDWAQVKASWGWSYWYYCKHNNPYDATYPESILCGYTSSDVTAPSKKPCFDEWTAFHDAEGDNAKATVSRGFCDGHARAIRMDYRDRVLSSYTSRSGVKPTVLLPPFDK